MIKRLPDTLPDATCADPATPTACTGRDGDHAERWQAGVCAYIAEGSGDGPVCTGPVRLEAEIERLQAEVDRLSGRAAASELARLSREAREVRQALDMPDAAHDAVVAAIASMRREGADLLAREAALRMAAARQTGWECPTTYEGVRAQVRLMDDLREQGKAAVADLRRWHDLLRADLGAVLCALGVPDAIEHVGTPHFEGALARASNAARALEAAAPARDLATAVRDFVGGVSYADRPGEREAALVAELTKVGAAVAEVRQALQAAPGGLDPEVRAGDPAGLLRAVAGRLRSLAERPAPDGPSGGQRQPEAAGEATIPPGDLVRAYDADTSPGDDAWDALLCWEARGCEVRAWPEDKPIHQERCDLGGKVVELRRQQDGREVVYVRSAAPRTSDAPAPDRDDAARALPRVVEWADLKPGDLALDAGAAPRIWRQDGKRSGSWRADDGTRFSGTREGIGTSPDYVMSRRAILLARGVPKRASAIRAAWEAVRKQAERLAEQARQEGA